MMMCYARLRSASVSAAFCIGQRITRRGPSARRRSKARCCCSGIVSLLNLQDLAKEIQPHRSATPVPGKGRQRGRDAEDTYYLSKFRATLWTCQTVFISGPVCIAFMTEDSVPTRC